MFHSGVGILFDSTVVALLPQESTIIGTSALRAVQQTFKRSIKLRNSADIIETQVAFLTKGAKRPEFVESQRLHFKLIRDPKCSAA
jgi:hypothetical protein